MRSSRCYVWMTLVALTIGGCVGSSGQTDDTVRRDARPQVNAGHGGGSVDVGAKDMSRGDAGTADLSPVAVVPDVAPDRAPSPADVALPGPMVDAPVEIRPDVFLSARPDLPPRPVLTPPLGPDAGGPADCTGVVGADLLRVVDHPAGGTELTVRLLFKDGVPPQPRRDLGACVSVEDRAGKAVGSVVVAKRLATTVQVFLIDPGQTAAEAAAVLAVVKALLADRPATDRIGLYRWGGDISQISGFLGDRNLAARLAGEALGPDLRPRVPVADAVATVVPLLMSPGDVALDAARAVVVLSPRKVEIPTTETIDGVRGAAQMLWSFVGAAMSSEGPPSARLEFAVGVEKAIGERLLQYQNGAHLGIGLCGTGAAWQGQIRVVGGKIPTPFEIPAALAENLTGTCDYAAVAAGRRVFPRRIEFMFTPAQRLAAAQAFGTKNDFDLSVRPSLQQLPITATAHYRGNGSLRCQRPNFSLSLEGKRPRFWMPGSAGSEFFLISLCADSHYLRTFTMAQLLSSEGVYPGPFELVELVIDGQTRGVYLLTENLVDWMRNQHRGVQAVIRRNSAPEGTTVPEVDWSASKPALAAQKYNDILGGTVGLAGAALDQGLLARMDLDGYLRWIALMTTFMSGDYVDEVFFMASATADAQGRPRTIHTVFTWDPDDVFSPCHGNGRNAIVDPWGLLFCTESELDKRVFAEPLIYQRYADILERVATRMSRARFEAALGQTTTRLLEYFRDPATLAAMTELGQENPAAIGSYAAIEAALAEEVARLLSIFDMNRTTLLTRVAMYRLGRKP